MSNVIIQEYFNTHEQLAKTIEGQSEEQLKWKARQESWSITEVLAHLADHSIVVSFRIRDILAGTTVQLPVFNQNSWVIGQLANEGNAADSLEFFRGIIHYNSLLLRRLGDAEWQRSGVNFKGENVRIVDIIRSFTAHVQNHLAQIERIKRASNS